MEMHAGAWLIGAGAHVANVHRPPRHLPRRFFSAHSLPCRPTVPEPLKISMATTTSSKGRSFAGHGTQWPTLLHPSRLPPSLPCPRRHLLVDRGILEPTTSQRHLRMNMATCLPFGTTTPLILCLRKSGFRRRLRHLSRWRGKFGLRMREVSADVCFLLVVSLNAAATAWISYLSIAVLIATLALALFNASKDQVARNFAYVYAVISIGVLVCGTVLYEYPGYSPNFV